jgi:hypothetical protein
VRKPEKTRPSGNVDVNGRMTLKWIFGGLELTVSEYDSMVSSC